MHKKHISKLEKILNMLQENQLSYKKIIDIKDSVDDYIKRNDESDYEEMSDLFEELELDKISSLSEYFFDDFFFLF